MAREINGKAVKRKKTVKKKKKGFTLIELLAVIIILGVLMIIAIPSVTEYIQSSRKNAYVTTASQYVTGARNKINSAEIPMYDIEATYYLPTSCISLEKGGDSPFGDIEEGYIVVTYDGYGYDYYFTVRDSANMGILLTSENLLANEKVLTGIKSLDTTVAIEGKEKILVIENCSETTTEKVATSTIPEKGSYEQKEISTMTTPYFNKIYRCADLRDNVNVDSMEFSLVYYENGDGAIFTDDGTASVEKSAYSYLENKIINVSDNKSIASVSSNGKVIDFNDGDYGLDNLWYTCTLAEDTTSLKFNKEYIGTVTENGASYSVTFVFYEDGSSVLKIEGQEDSLLPVATFIYTTDMIISTNENIESMYILESGNQIKYYDFIFELKK